MRVSPRTVALIILTGLALSAGPLGLGGAFAQPTPGPYPPPGTYPPPGGYPPPPPPPPPPSPYPPPGAYPPPPPPPQQNFTPGELVSAGHRFFGTVSRGLATVIETAVGQWGQPNGYVLGEEAGADARLGLRRRRRPHDDAGLQPARDPGDLPAICGHRRLCLSCGRLWNDSFDRQRHCAGANTVRCRIAARSQCRLFEIYAGLNLESILETCPMKLVHPSPSPARLTHGKVPYQGGAILLLPSILQELDS